MTKVRLTHVGGPTLLVEFDGWRFLTDPTFDDPGKTYDFGWGASSRKTGSPPRPPTDIGSDRRGPAHARSSRRQPRRGRPSASARGWRRRHHRARRRAAWAVTHAGSRRGRRHD